jgi:hypothetical protein
LVVFVVCLWLKSRDQIGHFDRTLGAITAFVCRTRFGLLICFSCQYAVCYGDTCLERNTRNRRGTFIADDFEMIGLATDHSTQGNQGVKLKGFGHACQRYAKF